MKIKAKSPRRRDILLAGVGLISTMASVVQPVSAQATRTVATARASKRLEGRDEPIIDADIAIIDAHHHLFDRPPQTYLLKEYLEDARSGHNIVGSVYIETQAFNRISGPEIFRPLGEVEFANGVGAMSASGAYGDIRVNSSIISHADLRYGDEIAPYLDACLAHAPERFKGVRQVTLDDANEQAFAFVTTRPPSGILQHPNFKKGLKHLQERQLTFDVAVFHHQIPDIIRLADQFPDIVMVLNHMGHIMALGLNDTQKHEAFILWRKYLAELAKRPNIYCKIGGLGLPFWGFGLHERQEPIGSLELAALWKPYIETAIECFGPLRSMMESDYPMDGRSCGFVPLWNALKLNVSGYSIDEKNWLFNKTASNVYKINLDI